MTVIAARCTQLWLPSYPPYSVGGGVILEGKLMNSDLWLALVCVSAQLHVSAEIASFGKSGDQLLPVTWINEGVSGHMEGSNARENPSAYILI